MSPLNSFMKSLLIENPTAIDIVFDNASSRSVASPLSPIPKPTKRGKVMPRRNNSIDRWSQQVPSSPLPMSSLGGSSSSSMGGFNGDSSSSSLSFESPVCPTRKDYLDKYSLIRSPEFIRRSSRNLLVSSDWIKNDSKWLSEKNHLLQDTEKAIGASNKDVHSDSALD